MVASVFLLWLYNKMLDPSGKQRWVIQETSTEIKRVSPFFGLLGYEKKIVTTVELASVALNGIAGERVILPLASAKALLDRDFNQNKVPETTKIDRPWDFEMARMVGVELLADNKESDDEEKEDDIDEDYLLSDFSQFVSEERREVWSNRRNRQWMLYTHEPAINKCLKSADIKRWGPSGLSADLPLWAYRKRSTLKRQEYINKVGLILEGDFYTWVSGLDSPEKRLQDPVLVESIDWVVLRRKEEINDIDYALKLGISLDDIDLWEPLRRIDLDVEIALRGLVEAMESRFAKEPSPSLKERLDSIDADSPSLEETLHRMKLQTKYPRLDVDN